MELKYINPKKGSQIIMYEGCSKRLNTVKNHHKFKLQKKCTIINFNLKTDSFENFEWSFYESIESLKKLVKNKDFKYIIIDKWYLSAMFQMNYKGILKNNFQNENELDVYIKNIEKEMYRKFNFIKIITILDKSLSKSKFLHNSIDFFDDEVYIKRDLIIKDIFEHGKTSLSLAEDDKDYLNDYLYLLLQNRFFIEYSSFHKKNSYVYLIKNNSLNPKNISGYLSKFTQTKPTKSKIKTNAEK
ncbi:hypothetical protein IL45_04750 [Nonlabens ulvanivorans]|uniref:Uncharacterized protein n=1 Tax=Nonlabens ulvanivorans TaxID=906888 RepID=A0A084JX41_NONUL|nr:hypothetical protein [Nonlabens ulvanivorans]KEZ93525.1 hypothetical protein IL45_04750 [Nonlabens ulvanivorans]